MNKWPRLLVATLLVLTCGPLAFAQITVLQDPEAVVFDLEGELGRLPDGNNNALFSTVLDLGFRLGFQGAELFADTSGILSFEVLGGRIGRDRSATLVLPGGASAAVFGGGTGLVSDLGTIVGGDLEVTGGQQISNDAFVFTTRRNANTANRVINGSQLGASGVAVFIPEVGSTSGLTDVILAFEDNGGRSGAFNNGRADFDDFIVRASFVQSVELAEIPEPATMLILALALGLIGWRVAARP